MHARPASVILTNGFIIMDIVIWFALGILIALNLHPGIPDQPVIRGVMAALSFAAAGALLIVFLLLRTHNRAAYILMLSFLGISSLLLFLDDFGWADLTALVLSLSPLILMIKDRAWYLQSGPSPADESLT